MKKKFSLILTNNLSKLNKKEQFISFIPLQLNDSKFSVKYFDKKFSNKGFKKNYEYCENFFNLLLLDLAKELNKIHKVDFSIKMWDIILGRWLRKFIQVSFKYYLNVQNLLKIYKINKIYTLDFNKYNHTVDDTESFEHAATDSNWVFSLYSKLLIYLNYKKINIVYDLPKNNFFNLLKKKKYFSNNFKKKLLTNIFSFLKIFVKNDYALISSTYLPFISEKILEMKFFQIPQFWDKFYLKKVRKNRSLRLKINEINKKNSKNLFKNFIYENIFDFLPKYVLENFANIESLLEKSSYPEKPKFIFTSNSYAYDEVFKFYMAKQSTNKTPIIIGQHGNNYFTQIWCNYLSEFNYADKIISWGFNKGKKIKRGYNFKTLKQSSSINSNSKLVIVFDHIGITSSLLCKSLVGEINHLKEMVEIIKSLSSKIKKKTILRLNPSFYNDYFGFKYINFFKDLNVEIDDGSKNIKDLMNDARLVLFNYDSTGVLENFILNIPTILFCEKDYLNSVNSYFWKKYFLLKKNQIMFTNKFKTSKYINENWDNLNKLWLKKKNQATINKFNNNFNLKPKNFYLNELKNILLKK